MNHLLSKLLGRKAENSANLAAEIEARKVTLAEAQARVSAAASARANALDALDEPGMARADGEATDAARAVELGTKALDILTTAHAKAIETEKAEARAVALAALVARRKALGDRLESEYRAAAAVLADILGEVKTLQRDVAEAGAEREVEGLPSVPRGLALNDEAVGNVSRWLGDALSGPPAVSESPKEASFRAAEEARARRKAEEAEARRIKIDTEREEGRAAREAADAKARERERNLYYPTWRDHLDSAR